MLSEVRHGQGCGVYERLYNRCSFVLVLQWFSGWGAPYGTNLSNASEVLAMSLLL